MSLVKMLKSYSPVKAVISNLTLMIGGGVSVSGLVLGILTMVGHGSYGMLGLTLALVGGVLGGVAAIMLKLEFAYAPFHYKS